MGQHRTRKEKEKIKISRTQQVAESSSEPVSGMAYSYVSNAETSNGVSAPNLLKVDKQYIIKDLIKTVTISSILLLVVIGIYFYLRYN